MTPRARLPAILLLAAALLLPGRPASAAELTVDLGGRVETFTTGQLLARPDAATIEVRQDVVYGRPTTYRAVPLRGLLQGMRLGAEEDVEVAASDGFVTVLPAALVFPPAGGGSVPMLAIEPPDAPWPSPGQGMTTGPFYLVWLDPAASGVRSEQWPFAVAAIRPVPSAAVRWPEIAVGGDVPTGSPVRAGQALVVTQCMVCHPVNGAGAARIGPDLNLPLNPTEYFQPSALKAFLRDPASVRRWPEMRMQGFDATAMSDADLDAVVAYLAYMAGRKKG